MENKTILITGGCGFIGSNFINYLIDNFDSFNLLNLDYEGIGSNKSFIKAPRTQTQVIEHLKCDISSKINIPEGDNDLPFDYLVHFAAESHVDRSISAPDQFIKSNVMGTIQMLELARNIGVKRFCLVSTDEVYGSVKRKTKETAKYNPSSVYTASKVSAEVLANAYKVTHGMDIVVTRCSNNFGPNQFEENLIPMVVKSALTDKKIPIYDEGKQLREWTFVDNHIEHILNVLKYGKSGETYNIGQGNSITNIKLVKTILDILGKDHSIIENIPNGRLSHEFKYAIDISKYNSMMLDYQLDYQVEDKFDIKLKDTVNYYAEKFNN